MNSTELKIILDNHKEWLLDNSKGTRAYLSGANLYVADLSGVDLSGAYLTGAYLSGADLTGADLSGAYLSGANLTRADLSGANLTGVDLYGANLSGAKGIVSITTSSYQLWVTDTHIRIGCRSKTHKEWSKVTCKQAVEMGLQKEYYKTYKDLIAAATLQLKAQRVTT